MNIFDNKAKNWENDNRKLKQTESIVENLKEYLNSNNIALDYGTGTGLIAYSIRNLVKSIIAIDNSKGMLSILEKKIRDNNIKNIEVLNMDLVNSDFNSTVDVIIITMTLHHIKDIKNIFNKFYKIINEGGYLIIADLLTEDGTFHENNKGVKHFGFEQKFIKENLKATGFKIIDFKNIFKFKKNDKIFNMFLSISQK